MGLPEITSTLDYQNTTAKAFDSLIRSSESLGQDEVVAYFPTRDRVGAILRILSIQESYAYHPRTIIEIPGVKIISDQKIYNTGSSHKENKRTIVWTRKKKILPLIESKYDYVGDTYLNSESIGFYLLGRAALLRYFASEQFTG